MQAILEDRTKVDSMTPSDDAARPRAIFISDAHLGCRYANASALLDFLQKHRPDYLYIVGDFLDGWQLRKSWYWNKTYSRIMHRIFEMHEDGVQVRYAPGNHDEFLRDFLYCLGDIRIQDEFVHHTADRRRLLVTHGDQFDRVTSHSPWLSHLGDIGYNLLLFLNRQFNRVRRMLGMRYWSFSAAIKRKVKEICNIISDFETKIVRHARQMGCDGVVCGHIHAPTIFEREGIIYYNTGDWVENCTALIERRDGALEIVRHPTGPAAAPAKVEAIDVAELVMENAAT